MNSKGYVYSGSNNADDLYNEHYNFIVGTKAPNELGLHDLTGNVWEMCWDRYGTYSSETQVDPVGPDTGDRPVLRGGGSPIGPASVTLRITTVWGLSSEYGFRIVLPAHSPTRLQDVGTGTVVVEGPAGTTTDTTPEFSWMAAEGSQFQLQIADTEAALETATIIDVSGTSYTPPPV